mgnify:CR=1 FL=1
MADFLPHPPPPEGSQWAKGPLAYSEYQNVHNSYIDSLENEGVVVDCRLSFLDVVSAGTLLEVNLKGRVVTRSGGLVVVNKWLEVVSESPVTVQTREYDYHARFVPERRRKGQDVFRYDNCHGGTDTLHRHRFDTRGRPCGQDTIALEDMPSLTEVIRHAEFYAAYLRDFRGD